MFSRKLLYSLCWAGLLLQTAQAEPVDIKSLPKVTPLTATQPGALFAKPRSDPVIAAPLATRLDEHPEGTHRAWVFFTDKQVRDATDLRRLTSERETELSPRAIQRRQLRAGKATPVDHDDLPPSPAYVMSVLAGGATLRQTSCWLNAVSIDASAEQLRVIAKLTFVRKIQPVARAPRRAPWPVTPVVSGDSGTRTNGPAFYGASYDQLNQIGVVAANNAGYTGAGIVIGILDTGFNRTHISFNQNTGGAHPVQVLAEHDFIANDGDTTQQPGDPAGQSSHGTYILGTLGAYHPGVLVGGAYDASFLLAKTEDISQEVPAEEDNYVAGLEWIEMGGADLATSSLGYIDWYTSADLDGQTAVTTVAVNMATANGLVCCTAAGNQGHDANPTTLNLLAPADALAVLACGAVDSSGVIASFSSDGPSFDGRVKPEVLARGVATATVSFSDNTSIVGVSGTSLSTPLLAAGTALIIQAHPDWSVDKIRRALFQTAGDFLVNSTYDPVYVRGYGIIDINAAIGFVHGDVNGDGFADGRDVPPFVAALLGTNPDVNQRRRADCDASGVVTLSDTSLFVSDLLGL